MKQVSKLALLTLATLTVPAAASAAAPFEGRWANPRVRDDPKGRAERDGGQGLRARRDLQGTALDEGQLGRVF
jgi:hypothetical protein